MVFFTKLFNWKVDTHVLSGKFCEWEYIFICITTFVKKKKWELFIALLYEELDLETWNNLGYFKCILYFEKGYK